MRFLAAVVFAAAAAVAAPASAAPDGPCSKTERGRTMQTCLLDRAEALLHGKVAVADPEESAPLWVKLNEVSVDAGDLKRARRAADRITAGGQRRLAEARVAALMARQGDRKGAAAILDAMLAQPLPAGQVDWALASVLVALNEPARTAAWLEGLPADRQVDGLFALVRAQQETKRPERAEKLLRDFGDKGTAENTSIIVHSRTAMDFIAAGRLDASRRMLRLMPDVDRPRLEARLALKQDQMGRRAEAEAALDALANLPRSSDARMARAVLAARHGDFAAAQKWFPPALSYDQALLDELFAALAKGGQGARITAMVATMNNSKDKASVHARLALASARAGKTADAAAWLNKARAILDPLVNLEHGAAPLLIDFSTALGDTVEAMVALDQLDEGRAFTNKLEVAVQADRYGLARPGVISGLIATNKALFKGKIAQGKPGDVRRLLSRPWRTTAGLTAFLDAGMPAEAALIAEREGDNDLSKTGDFLAVAQYIAKH